MRIKWEDSTIHVSNPELLGGKSGYKCNKIVIINKCLRKIFYESPCTFLYCAHFRDVALSFVLCPIYFREALKVHLCRVLHVPLACSHQLPLLISRREKMVSIGVAFSYH